MSCAVFRMCRVALVAAVSVLCVGAALAGSPKAFVVIYADDYGYGDVAAYNQPCRDSAQCPGSYTPNLDRMAAEGMRFTSWYAPHCVCSPSRASLQTGRYPIRTSVYPGVFSPDDTGGMPPSEVTIAEQLKAHNPQFRTTHIGKWHLGHLPRYLPINQGYDHWLGIPWSHDYCPCPCSLTLTKDCTCRDDDPPCGLYADREIVEQPAFLPNLTSTYASHAVQFMAAAGADPFFLSLSLQHTHHPQFRASNHVNASAAHGRRPDAFGDANVEMDAAVGQVLDWLRTHQLQDDVLVVFAADNGPSLIRSSPYCGSAGALNCGKFSTWEGGQRTAGIAWGGGVPGNTTSDALVSAFDVFPTVMALAGAPLPADRVIDGKDLSPVLYHGATSLHPDFVFYGLTGKAHAVRVELPAADGTTHAYKVHLYTSSKGSPSASGKDVCGPPKGYSDGTHATFSNTTGSISGTPWVFDLTNDAGERHPLDPTSEPYKAAVKAATAVLVASQCYQQGDSGCMSTPVPTCHANGTVPPWPACDVYRNSSCTWRPWTPNTECTQPFTPSNSTNCTLQADTRQSGDPIAKEKATSQADCCRKCFQSDVCVVSVFVPASGDCNLHDTDNHGVAAKGSNSCHTGRVPFNGSVEVDERKPWVVPPDDEYIAGLTEYDVM